MRFLIVILMLLAGCASNTPLTGVEKYPNVDKELKIYVMRFDYFYYKYHNHCL
jgi:hypothetical protein